MATIYNKKHRHWKNHNSTNNRKRYKNDIIKGIAYYKSRNILKDLYWLPFIGNIIERYYIKKLKISNLKIKELKLMLINEKEVFHNE